MQPIDFAALIEAMPDAVVVTDMQARIVYANASVERLLGWAPGSLVGQHLHAIQPERMHGPHDAGFRRYAMTGEQRLFGKPIRVPAVGPNGIERDMELNLAEISGADGQRLVMGVMRDLGERVELERSLRVTRYLKATSAAAAQLWTRLDPALVLQTLTDVLVKDFDSALARAWVHEPETNSLVLLASSGVSREIQRESRARIDLETYPYKVGVVARTRQPVVKNGLLDDPELEHDWILKEGLQGVACLPLMSGGDLLGVMVHFSREPIPPEAAEVIGHLAALAAAALNDARLVEQEREARSAADRGRSHFELLASVSERLAASLDPEVTVQAVADAVVPRFADWCVVDLLRDDRTLETVASAHSDPLLAQLIGELRLSYPPNERSDPPHAIYRAIDSGHTIREVETTEALRRRAVDARHLEILTTLGIGSHIVAVLATRGRVIGAISLIRRPEREAFSVEDVSTAEDLARRAAMATDNARLYRSAQQAVEIRDRFLAIASHELRTPLAVVYGHWELVARWMRSDPEAAARPNAERIDTSIQRLGRGVEQLRRLVEELLDVSRLAHGTMELRRSPVDLVSVVRRAVEDVSAAAAGQLQLELPKGALVGSWDEARLGQVIDNVLLNAMKYSTEDGVVEVSLTRKGRRARLRISDQGIGIPPAELESIFEPFNRGRNVTAQHFPGLGLGLAVSREIVTRLGGRMWAESDGEGRGSSFFVELDLAAAGDPSQPDAPRQGAEV